MAKTTYQIPFDASGDMMSYNYGGAVLKDNYVFDDTLTYDGYGRGRSAANMHFKDSKGHTYTMFLSDFDNLMRTNKLVGMSVKGKWTFVKKGQNFGIKFIG